MPHRDHPVLIRKMNIKMHSIKVLLDRQFPRNFLINKPLWGSLSIFAFIFLFLLIYQPMKVHKAGTFNFSLSMLMYCLIITAVVLLAALLINRLDGFSKSKIWTVSKELQSIAVILFCIGISAYFAGFFLEDPAPRWNTSTFLNSFSRSVGIGLIPILLASFLNFRHLMTPEIFQEYQITGQNAPQNPAGKLICIQSRAKKEELSFTPEEFIYAESEGNYVVFHLVRQERALDVVIRSSISEIERQLLPVVTVMRIHRAFIVNLEKVVSKKGNSLGYRIKLKGSQNLLPVSRQNTQKFDQAVRQLLLSVHT